MMLQSATPITSSPVPLQWCHPEATERTYKSNQHGNLGQQSITGCSIMTSSQIQHGGRYIRHITMKMTNVDESEW